MLKTLNKHLKEDTDLGLQLKALPSILKYPEAYSLGKQSIHLTCKFCGDSPRTVKDTLNVQEKGICLFCEFDIANEDMLADYNSDRASQYQEYMEEMGLDPDNMDDINYFMETME